MKRAVPTRRGWGSVLGKGLPLWVYWAVAGSTVAGATVFAVMYGADVPAQLRSDLYRVVWGGPIACVLVAIIMTIARRTGRD